VTARTDGANIVIFRGAIVKATWVFAAVLLAAGAMASAQDMPAGPGAAEQKAPAPPPQDPRVSHIKMMESVLTTAVRTGATVVANQIQGVEFVTGTARARGFSLDGYGVFFDVDIPMMQQSGLWTTQTLLTQRMIDNLHQVVAGMPDGPERRGYQADLRRLEGSSADAGASQVAERGMAAAQTVTDPKAAAPRDANEMYTDAVKTALIDAMLDYSSSLKLGPEEWLTVAAQDGEGPLPGELYSPSTTLLRVKGSDLAAFVSGKLTRDEVLKKVVVREFQ
jgi:hypothetical protein